MKNATNSFWKTILVLAGTCLFVIGSQEASQNLIATTSGTSSVIKTDLVATTSGTSSVVKPVLVATTSGTSSVVKPVLVATTSGTSSVDRIA